MTRTRTQLLTFFVALVALSAPTAAHAFCGFYVSGGGADAYNNATQVVLMREGTRTILSMQNNYQGPLANFAMVVPVPVVLMEDNVKTLDKSLFDKIDELSAPRLVEYWEQDPCNQWEYSNNGANNGANNNGNNGANNGANNGVVVEAEFKVGEYEIVILSAQDSGGLTRWLDTNDYNIPDGAAPHLQPYIDAGQYFFVARVIAEEVAYEDGRAVLSPLRFSYDSEQFSLPIRLGLISAEDQQDLLVYILAREQRYEAANYPNVTIPTNITVHDTVRDDFGAFYNALFTRTLDRNPGAVVTEYSWAAQGCDPCPPGGVLDPVDLTTLGADTLGGNLFGWVLTRLHARYDANNVGEDIVLRAAGAIEGGRERYVWSEDLEEGQEPPLEEGSRPWEFNNFQGRYAIRHPWEGEVACDAPEFGHWGGPPGQGNDNAAVVGGAVSPNTSGDDYRTQDAPLEELVAEDVPEIGVTAGGPAPGNNGVGNNGVGNNGVGGGGGGSSSSGGCATVDSDAALPAFLLVLGLGLVVVRRRG